jgi:hypothetical protein
MRIHYNAFILFILAFQGGLGLLPEIDIVEGFREIAQIIKSLSSDHQAAMKWTPQLIGEKQIGVSGLNSTKCNFSSRQLI